MFFLLYYHFSSYILTIHTQRRKKRTYILLFFVVVVVAGTIQGSEVHSNYKWSERVQLSRDSTHRKKKDGKKRVANKGSVVRH